MFKQKIYAIICLLITIWLCTKGLGTLAIITLPMATFLFFSKFNYTRHDY